MVSKIDIFDEYKRPLENVTMETFNNSLKFFWGIAKDDDDWDVLNNPYVEFRGHQLRSGLKFDNIHEFHKCTREELTEYLPREDMFNWYPQAICFSNL